MAIGGGTNAVIHLLALAGRVGVPLSLARFDEIARTTPRIANLRPSGERLIEDLHRAGGVPALLRELDSLLHRDALTITGATLASGYETAANHDSTVIASLATPFSHESGLAVLRGSLAPNGAVIKRARGLARPEPPSRPRARVRGRLRRRGADRRSRARRQRRLGARAAQLGPARVARHARVGRDADSEEAARAGRHGHGARVRRPHERHRLRHRRPARLARVVRRRTARGRARRRPDRPRHRGPPHRSRSPPGRDRQAPLRAARAAPRYRRGYGALYLEHVLQAEEGCDFDFLRAHPGEPAESEPLGLLSGWVGGW